MNFPPVMPGAEIILQITTILLKNEVPGAVVLAVITNLEQMIETERIKEEERRIAFQQLTPFFQPKERE